jgi:hypothetical protein
MLLGGQLEAYSVGEWPPMAQGDQEEQRLTQQRLCYVKQILPAA